MYSFLKKLQVPALIIIVIAGCTQKEASTPLPVELTIEHSCTVCGMLTVGIPGSKAQIHYSNGDIFPFCCTSHMFSYYLQPDSPPNVTAIYVNDMANAEGNIPAGGWIDARTAFYVFGGDLLGPHGESLAPFAELKDAEGYVQDHGGKIVGFDDVTMKILRPDAHGH